MVASKVAFSPNSQVHLQADTIEYIKDQNLVMARGQVHLQQGSDHLYADNLRIYDTESQDVPSRMVMSFFKTGLKRLRPKV